MLTTTPVLHGLGSLQTLLATARAATDRRDGAAVVVDPALLGSEAIAELTSILDWSHIPHDVVEITGEIDLDATRSAAAALGTRALVVSLGGGSTLDLVKIGLQFAAAPELAGRIARSGRAGLVHLGDGAPPRPRHIAVPTTLGTGAERSPRACLSLDGHKRLLVGGGLAPDAAVLDERATRGLPAHLVTYGAAEAFLRLAGVLTGDTVEPTDGLEDDLSLTLLAHTVRAGELAATSTDLVPGRVRLELAKASSWSQAPEFHRFGRDPFAAKGWYIANELSTMTGSAKVSAFGAVTAALWTRLAADDRRLGSRRRLQLVWDRVRDVCPTLPASPSTGVRVLLDRWGVASLPPLDVTQIRAVATECDLRWGRGQPALGAFTRDDLTGIITDAVTTTADTPAGAVR